MKIKKWLGMVSLAAVAAHGQAEWEYLDNGVVRIGVDRSRGACVGYFAESESRRNLLNHFDTGRFIQQSYYGDPDGSDWDGKPWNYNPVQGGSWKNNPSKLLEFKNDSTDGIITAKIMPRSWSGGALCPEAIMEETITLDGAVAHIHFKLTYTGEDQSEARHQEMPAVFVDYALANLVFMNEGELVRRVPEWPNEYGMASENWTAYLDDKDWGIGILTPGTTEFTSYRFKGDEDVGPEGVACSYVAPVRTLKLTKGLVLEHDVYLTVGWLPEIRERFFQLRKKEAEATAAIASQKYNDGRPAATLRMDALDHGIVLQHGDGPDQCDLLGARDPWVFESDGTYYMHYDASGPEGWLCSLAVSQDLLHWEKKGPILDVGAPSEEDSKSVIYGIPYFDGEKWHLFYLGTPNMTEPPDLVPSFPYLTMKAKGDSPAGPWYKQKEVIPFRTKPGTFYSITASPGQTVKHGEEFIQFFSATTSVTGKQHVQRTLGIARTQDLDGPWTIDPQPIVPTEEQIENSALYYEKSNETWFLFTNHIGLGEQEYTDAIWVYWSKDLNQWNPENKAIVLDGQNCSWSKKCIGLPSVVQKGNRLALFYDSPGGDSTGHMKRNIGLAWLDLPLSPPTAKAESTVIDPQTVKQWSAPYRNWHYYPDHVISGNPEIDGFDDVYRTDVPTIFQLPDDSKWYMTFIGYDDLGYQSFVTESDDLIHWTNRRLAMGYGPKDSFDYGGCVLGAFLYEDYDIKSPRILKKHEGKYISLYGSYPRQGGYELRPGYEGVASSEDGFVWQRAKDEPILSVHDSDCGTWEKDCIYMPWLVEHEGKYYNHYNAANGQIEQLGLALSDDLLNWQRYEQNPVIPIGPAGSCNEVFSSDGKVFWDTDHWVMFFFGVDHDGAHIMAAFSRDLHHWTVDPDPLYKSGGNPSGLDKEYAHKISLVWNPENETFYMFYNAVGDKGRGIGLITSKPLMQK